MFTYIHTRRGIHKSIYFYTHTHTYEKNIYTTHINTHILTHAHTRTHTEMRSTMAKYHMPANPCVCNTATHCNTLQHSATQCNAVQRSATREEPKCDSLQLTATHCNSLQHTRLAALNNGTLTAVL